MKTALSILVLLLVLGLSSQSASVYEADATVVKNDYIEDSWRGDVCEVFMRGTGDKKIFRLHVHESNCNRNYTTGHRYYVLYWNKESGCKNRWRTVINELREIK